MRQSHSVKRDLVDLLVKYKLDEYTNISAYALAEQLVNQLEDLSRQNCKSSIWSDHHDKKL